MKKELQEVLKDLTYADRRELYLAVQLALAIRDTAMYYKLSDENLASELGVKEKQIPSVLDGTYEYDFKIID